ncbi:MAG: HAMP domain-containing sensor histidine kinase, partial [Pseudomonadota bacterium]
MFVPSTVRVCCDPVILRRMVQNLISNAIRHSEGTRVLLGVRRRATGVSIEVYDNGKGIPKDRLTHIFEEFSRIDGASSERSPGLGLGL